MKNEILKYKAEALAEAINSAEELENFKIKYLGKKGILNDIFGRFKSLPNEEKKEIGQILNEFKQAVSNRIADLQSQFSANKKVCLLMMFQDLLHLIFMELDTRFQL